MKVSELLADLTTCPQGAQLVLLETDVIVGPGSIFTIDSILGGNENSVTLMGKSLTRKPVDVFFSSLVADLERGKPTKTYKAAICESSVLPGKYEVTFQGSHLQGNFDTEEEAKLFMRGVVLGFEMGSTKRSGASNDAPGAIDRV